MPHQGDAGARAGPAARAPREGKEGGTEPTESARGSRGQAGWGGGHGLTQPEKMGTLRLCLQRPRLQEGRARPTPRLGRTEALRVRGCQTEEEARKNAASNVIY